MKLKARIIYLNPDATNIIGTPDLRVNNSKVNFHKDNDPDNWDDISINFSKGEAKLNLLYNDAGKLKLQFAYDLDKTTTGYEMSTIDSNNEITFSPFGIYLSFQNIDSKDNDNIGSFSTKLKAGSDYFIINAKGVCYDSNDDKSPKDGVPDSGSNLSDNKMPLKNFKANLKILYNISNPNGGVGNLTPSEIKESDFKNGIGTVKTTFSDVGILSINSVIANNYIISGNNITGWPLHKYIGRFIPHHFSIASKVNGLLRENCDTFNYAGDTLSYLVAPSFKIIAQNKDNKTTKNYKNDFNRLAENYISIDYPSRDDNQFGNNREIEISITPASGKLISNGDGTFKYTFGNDKIVYLKNDNAKINSFAPMFSLSIKDLRDKDEVTCLNIPQKLTVSGQSIKYGELDISDNYGPETENLKLLMKTFFWNNGTWELNIEDSCTSFDKSDFILKNFTDKLNSGETNIINFSNISEGVGDITLSAPGQNNYGSVDVDFSSNSFLHNDNSSSGKATFGLYRGRDRVIMWEEVPAEDE